MKHLILLRHAKSSWSDADLPDLDRPLSKRGERDAPRMGARLKARNTRPSLIVTSHAKRALRTAEYVAEAIDHPRQLLHIEPELYLADPARILALLAQQDDRWANLLLIGHNPGLTELANQLLPELMLDNLPTAGVIAIDLETDTWAGIARAPARLAYYDYPKNPDLSVIGR